MSVKKKFVRVVPWIIRITVVIAVACALYFIFYKGVIACDGNDFYNYQYHFRVIGGHGKLYASRYTGDVDSSESPLEVTGGYKRVVSGIKFIAVPEEGYKVKEWNYMGKTVEGNITNEFVTGEVRYGEYITITVEFELIDKLITR